jgi:hypothetical protein
MRLKVSSVRRCNAVTAAAQLSTMALRRWRRHVRARPRFLGIHLGEGCTQAKRRTPIAAVGRRRATWYGLSRCSFDFRRRFPRLMGYLKPLRRFSLFVSVPARVINAAA